MSVIRVSGSRQGKINRVHGSSNYYPKPSRKKKTKNDTEKSKYTKFINVTKSFVRSEKYDLFIKQTDIFEININKKTRLNILRAYKQTLSINGKIVRQKKFASRITDFLPMYLKHNGVSKSLIKIILKHDPQYYTDRIILDKNKHNEKLENEESLIKKNLIKEKPIKDKETTNESTIKSYYQEIIRFSYMDYNNESVNEFINRINREKKILSNNLVLNIIVAYKQTIKESNIHSQNKQIFKVSLEKNLLRNGVHPETIKNIVKLDT